MYKNSKTDILIVKNCITNCNTIIPIIVKSLIITIIFEIFGLKNFQVRPIIPDIHSYQVSSQQIPEPQIMHNQPMKLGNLDIDPHFSFDPIGLKTYKGES